MTIEGVQGAVDLVAGIQCLADTHGRLLDLEASGQEVAIDAATRILCLMQTSTVRCAVVLRDHIGFTNIASETGNRG